MKKRIFSVLFAILIMAGIANAGFLSDIILTSKNAIWTDSRTFSSLSDALTEIGSLERDLYIAKEESFSGTIPSTIRLHFLKSGSINNSGQLAINTKQIFAGDQLIFTGVGNIDFADGSVIKSGWFRSIESAFAKTVNDTVTLIVSKSQTITGNFSPGNDVTLKWESPGNILTVNTGVEVGNLKDIEAGNYQLFAGAGDFDFLDGTVLNLSWFVRLRSVNTWVENEDVTLIVNESSTVSYSQTTDNNMTINVLNGGMLYTNAGVILTIGSFKAGTYQTFDGPGITTFAANSFATKELISEWWGENTVPGTTDLTLPLQQWLDASYQSKIPCFLSGGRHLTGKLYYSGQSIRGILGSGAYEATAYNSEMSSLIGKDSSDILYYSVDSPYNADIFLRGTILKDILIIVDDTTDASASFPSRGGAGNAGIALEHLDGNVNAPGSSDNFTFIRARLQNVAIISKSMDTNGKNKSIAFYQQGLIYDVVFDQVTFARCEYGFWGDYPGTNSTDIEYAPDSLKFLNCLIECMNPFRSYNSFASTIDSMQVYGAATDDKGIRIEQYQSHTRGASYFWHINNLYQEIGNIAGVGEIGLIDGRDHVFTGGVLVNAETEQYYTWDANFCRVDLMRINNKLAHSSITISGSNNLFTNIVTAFDRRGWFTDTGIGNRIDIFDSAVGGSTKKSSRSICQNSSRHTYPALAQTSHFAHDIPSTPYYGNEDLFFWPSDLTWDAPVVQPTITQDATIGGSGEYATMLTGAGAYYFSDIGMVEMLLGYQVPEAKVRIYAMVKMSTSNTTQNWNIDVNGAGTEIDDKDCIVTTSWSVVHFDADLTGLTKGHNVFIRVGAPTINQEWYLAWVVLVPQKEHNLNAHIGTGWGIYDFDINSGAIASHILGTLFDNAVVTRAFYEIVTPFTSGGAATVAIEIATDDANGIVTATAFDNAVFNAGYHETIQTGTVANFTTQTTGVRHINLTVAGAVLTAGKIKVWWEYVVGE